MSKLYGWIDDDLRIIFAFINIFKGILEYGISRVNLGKFFATVFFNLLFFSKNRKEKEREKLYEEYKKIPTKRNMNLL